MALLGGRTHNKSAFPSVIFAIPPAHSRFMCYAVPVIAILSAFALTMATAAAQRTPVPFFTLAVLLSTLYGGRKSGWTAAILAVFTTTCLLIPRLGTAVNWNDGVRVVAFAMVAVSVVVLVGKLQDTAEQLNKQREWLDVTLKSIGDAVIASDVQGGIAFMNPVAESVTGWPRAEALGRSLRDVFRIKNELTGEPVEDPVGKVIRLGGAVGLANHTALKTKDGLEVPIEDSAAPILDSTGKTIGAVLVFHDVSGKRRKEEQLRDVYRTLKAINNSNQAMLHATTEQALLQQVCKIITEDCGHAMMWIGFAEDDQDQSVRPVAHAGFDEGYLETAQITWADTEHGHGPVGTAIRTGQTCYFRNLLTDQRFGPWWSEAHKRGFASCLALPLLTGGKAFGAITIYSRQPEAFSEEEVRLLAELAADLAYGISTLRLRVAHEQAEEALRRAEQEWERTFNSVPDLIAILDNERRIVRVNQAMAQRLGATPEACAGMICYKSVHGVSEPPEFCPHSLTLRDRKEHIAEVYEEHLGGDFVVSTTPLFDEQGEMTGVVHVARNITERKQTEKALRQSESLYRGLFEHMAEGLAYCKMIFENGEGQDFVYLAVNPAFGTLTGLKEVIGKRVTEVIPGIREADPGLLKIYARVALTGVPEKFEMFVKALGMWFSISVYSPEKGFFVAIFDVITERKRAEEALLRSEKLASVGRMAASIAHEINNPLAAVVNTIFLAQTNADEPNSVRQYLDIADDELKRIAHITRQTLGFYRESSASATVSVNSILDAAVDLLRGKIRVKGTTIEKQYDGDLQVTAVPGELRQVFSNLLANSLDAMDQEGTVKLRVSRSTCVNGDQPRIRITVADNGKGIDAATLPRIFEPLFTTKEATGSGLGLWVSKQLIDKHGGAIRVRSSTRVPRRGTVFSIFLPAEDAPAAKSATASSS